MNTKKLNDHSRILILVLFVLLAFILSAGILPGCTGDSDGGGSNEIADPDKAYLAAINDARVAEPGEISNSLIAITKYQDGLIWEGEPGESRVLVVSWTGGDYYDDSVGQDYYLPVNVWVTSAPEMISFFRDRGYTSGNVPTLRVEQLLGLPPDYGMTKFVELWVDREDLFRPSPDPEITDHEAELDFPLDGFRKFDPDQLVKEGDTYSTYQAWFTNRTDTIYDGSTPYPWTRMGYTYDWGSEESHIGLSEFVVRAENTVGVKSVKPTEQYLQW